MIPTCLPPRESTRPQVQPPPGACDTHAHVFGPASQAGQLFDLFHAWATAEAARQRILVTNPALLYGFA